jgi:ketosteroid isomerase-like protein
MRLTSLLTATLLITAAASTPAAFAQSSRAEAGVHHWIDDFTRAFEARDTKAVMALYAPDVIAYDVIPPLQYTGSEAYAKDWATYFAGYKGPLAIEYRDLHIYTSGDLALVICLEHVTGTLNNGQSSSIWLRTTAGLRRVNGRWLDFHDHVSVPADFNTGKALVDLQP